MYGIWNLVWDQLFNWIWNLLNDMMYIMFLVEKDGIDTVDDDNQCHHRMGDRTDRQHGVLVCLFVDDENVDHFVCFDVTH